KADITPKPITGSFTAQNKVYDGNTDATVTGRSLTGAIAGDTVSLSGGNATFGNKNAGTDKTVTLTGATLAGADAGNYSLSSVDTAKADITARQVAGSFTASDKVYDGTTAATIATRGLGTGVLAGDTVTLSGGAATFGNKNAGQAKTVTGTGFALGGADAANYSLESSTLTASADITPKPISGSFKSANKVYDGNNSAAATDRALAVTIQGDDVNLAGGTAGFANK